MTRRSDLEELRQAVLDEARAAAEGADPGHSASAIVGVVWGPAFRAGHAVGFMDGHSTGLDYAASLLTRIGGGPAIEAAIQLLRERAARTAQSAG